MIITNKSTEWKEKVPWKSERSVLKQRRALITSFRNATALKADTLQLVATVFTAKRTTSPANVIYTETRLNIDKVNLPFKHQSSGRVNLSIDSFKIESPCEPAKKTQTSLDTPRKFFLVLETTCYVKNEYLAMFCAKTEKSKFLPTRLTTKNRSLRGHVLTGNECYTINC